MWSGWASYTGLPPKPFIKSLWVSNIQVNSMPAKNSDKIMKITDFLPFLEQQLWG